MVDIIISIFCSIGLIILCVIFTREPIENGREISRLKREITKYNGEDNWKDYLEWWLRVMKRDRLVDILFVTTLYILTIFSILMTILTIMGVIS